ncbi:HD domain-containing phosphohydrolase [Chitinimonas sp. BJYL2]|uniref:HD domain-containing phosphohydrolase n=1 Tax=Chitinimonas sp. BJYL2 TaxID=2976696 RepID=UPI0022B3C5D9|nr:HD domain-containing phosphohydrolase [Chitinimonas sp. BJYL2]
MNVAEVDFELLPDVMTEISDHLPALETDMQELVRYPDSVDLVSSAFRHVHTIKGDFVYCKATPIAELVNLVENVLQALREHRYACSPFVCEAVLQSMDRVREMARVLNTTRRFDETPIGGLLRAVEELGMAIGQPAADQAARHVLIAAHDPGDLIPSGPVVVATPPIPAAVYSVAHRQGLLLSQCLVQRIPAWHDRAERQLELVLALNQHYPQPQNVQALTLAVLWHDVGMLALPDAMLDKPPANAKEAGWELWTGHPERSAQCLQALGKGLDEAALIIRQHHHWADGRGFPSRTQPLHPGAQMLACADHFYSSVHKYGGDDRRGALRAVFDIHGGLDTRFDAMLVNAFTAMAQSWAAEGRAANG